ncbi:AIR synthase-related protein, partial [Burkholderia pseudomallei]
HDVRLGDGLPAVAQALLSDPQTSGGLLVACAPEAVADVLACFRDDGFERAAAIGEMDDGAARVDVS